MNEDRLKKLEEQFSQVFNIMFEGTVYSNWKSHPHLQGTPRRLAKMYVKELFSSLYLEEITKTKYTQFDNIRHYGNLIVQRCDVKSICAHHFLPFIGYCYVGYIPEKNGSVLGLSKLNRIVEMVCRKPQIQEELTIEIATEIGNAINHRGVAVYVEAVHYCAKIRGVKQDSTLMTTYHFEKLSQEEKDMFIRIVDKRENR